MGRDDKAGGPPVRWRLILGTAAGVVAGVAAYAVVPDLVHLGASHVRRLVPLWVRAPVALACLTALAVYLTVFPARALVAALPARWWGRAEWLAAAVLGAAGSWLLGGVCLLLLLGWVPHYLTWPVWLDPDQFMISAQSWDAGLRPYRDLPDFDFPGPIYLFWALGRAFGWGRTAPFYAADAALVVVLGAALVGWGRRRFGRALPGLLAFLMFLTFYLNLDYSLAAQRDWHASLGAVLGLLALEAWPGRAGRIVSAAAVAAGLAVRPQTVLFFPALASAVLEGAPARGGSWGRPAAAVGWWALAFAGFAALAFAPLAAAGVLDDFARCLGVASYGGPYNRVTPGYFLSHLADPLRQWQTVALLAALAVLALRPGPDRGPARTWALALAAALVYKPLSPVPHAYLEQPLRLVECPATALVAGWLLRGVVPYPWLRLGLVVAVVPGLSLRYPPRYFLPDRSLEACTRLVRGGEPDRPPPGCQYRMARRQQPGRVIPGRIFYTWDDYREVLDYLRRTTTPRTRVANFLRSTPFPAINGPAGRLTPFPAAGGVHWLRGIAPGDESRFARAVADDPDAVVVWVPGECGPGPTAHLASIEAAVRRHYRPEARFGFIEVWRRAPVGR